MCSTKGASRSWTPSSWSFSCVASWSVCDGRGGVLPTHCPPTKWKVHPAVSRRGTRVDRSRWRRHAIFLPWLRPQGYVALAVNCCSYLDTVVTRRCVSCDLHRARLWMKFLLRINKSDPYCSRYSSGTHVPLIPKILRSLGFQLASKSVPWCPTAFRSFGEQESSQCGIFVNSFRFPDSFRFPGFCGIDAKPSRIHIFRYSVAARQDWSLLRPSTRSDLIFDVKALGSVKQEGPFNLQGADWWDLPSVVHRCLHVDLPCVQ